ncbi:DUF429 domain-containing protein [Comamonas terrae]|uniref:DUF429 domain-containing protein n=1 Tax=Comamonas terrae TaxID=673548 RepID=A0ABW5UGJ8_9BURK|nr:DUF429 domain-containing protein [Comamonas terrae]
MQILGCDFSSSPGRRKPIVIARGRLGPEMRSVQLAELLGFATLDSWGRWLADERHTPWIGGFDMPFGLPRELVETLGWPTDWQACMDHYARLSRAQIREQFKAFCAARPAGRKFAHRATDGPAGSSPSMKWVNPPVAYMLHAGVPLLRAAGVHLPGLQPAPEQTPARVGLEAYPGLLARAVLGRRSYKSDDTARQTPERRQARQELIDALEQGRAGLGLRLELTQAQRRALEDDAKADALDAVLCLLQAGWAACRRQEGDMLYGLPPGRDTLEGWIVTAGALGGASH